jgi:predicted DNA-binding protein with PD1-like motif
MKSTKMAGDAGSETRVVVLDSGEEVFATLTNFTTAKGKQAKKARRQPVSVKC